MRTTVNIDDGLLQRLRKESERSKTSLSATLNRLLRRGLEKTGKTTRGNYQEETFPMGVPAGLNLDKALQLAALLEDQETMSKLLKS